MSNEQDQGKRLGKLFFNRLEKMLESDEVEMKAADYEMIRKVLSDNSITLASVRAGNFGKLAQQEAEKYPFPGIDGAQEEYSTPLN